MNHKQNQEGFTLIELLLYVAILSFIFFTASLLLTSMLNYRSKQLALTEVNETGDHAVRIISRTIRNAEAITSPTQASSASSITIDVVDVADDPTVFDLSAGALRMTEGAGSAIDLSSNRVTVSGLTFTNLSRTDTPGTVQFTFTVTYNNPDSIPAFEASKTFYGSATLRQP